MSAALVESVREASQAQMRRVAAQKASTSGDLHGMIGYEHRQLYALDLPAILAALTEAEALRAQVAAGQARGVALREALNDLYGYAHRQAPLSRFEGGVPVALLKGLNALSAPTDTAALRAFGERCVLAGWVGGNNYAFPDEPEELVVADIPPDAQQQIAAIVDRVLGGS